MAIAVAVALVAAGGVALEAVSGIAERRAPELAVSVNPLNGMAVEQLANDRFQAATTDREKIAEGAAKARDLALAAYKAEPLVPKSLAILSFVISDQELRGDVLALANRLNRRDLTLQLAVLEQRLLEKDEVAAVATLDELLRVHPKYSDQLFPPLQKAMLNPQTEPVFADLLDGSSPWHDRFAMSAVHDEAARLRLARLRDKIVITDENFDRQLIAGLAAQGELQAAGDLYESLAQSDERIEDGVVTLSWRGDYPPFDWQYVDRKDIRAQASLDDDALQIFARPGQGGVVATRIVSLPAGAKGEISLDVESTRAIVDGRVRLSIACADAQDPFAQYEVGTGQNTYTFDTKENACRAVRIEIYARSYRGEPVLRARIGRIRLG